MHALARYWWVLLLRGLIGILFGAMVLFRPGPSLFALVIVFGAYALVGGAFALASGIAGGEPSRRWELVFEGILGIIVGLITFLNPGISMLGLYGFIAAWALVTGILQIVSAVRLRHEVRTGWMAFAGVSSVLFGALMIALPTAGLLALTWLIGSYAIIFGVLFIALAFRLRRLKELPMEPTTRVPFTQVPV